MKLGTLLWNAIAHFEIHTKQPIIFQCFAPCEAWNLRKNYRDNELYLVYDWFIVIIIIAIDQ